jgi:predicted metalloprotease with PDZ domain
MNLKTVCISLLVLFYCGFSAVSSKTANPNLEYTVSMSGPSAHRFHMQLNANGLDKDSILLKLPKWTPGYYQIMNYADDIENISACGNEGENIKIEKTTENTWKISGIKAKSLNINYYVKADRPFVACSFLDSTHAYILPANNFLFIDGMLDLPVTVKINKNPEWSTIATGLEKVPGKSDIFTAQDFDILYDCPILIGNLEELTPFTVNKTEHRFEGYNIGNFDKELFISNLKKEIEAAVTII